MRGKKSGLQAGACATGEVSEWQRRRIVLVEDTIHDLLRPVSKQGISQPKGARWFCASIVSGCEFSLEEVLSTAGVEILVPRESYDIVKKGEKITKVRPSFRGYAFIRFAPLAEAFHALKELKEIRDFLGNGKEYSPILDAHMSVLKRKTEKVDVSRKAADKSIGQGAQVDIVHGPYTGFSGLVLQVRAKREPVARVFIEAFGQLSRDVEMPLAYLRKL